MAFFVSALYVTTILIPLTGSVLSLFYTGSSEIYFNAALGIFLYWLFLLGVTYYGSKLYFENFRQNSIIKNLNDDLTYTTNELDKIQLLDLKKNENKISETIPLDDKFTTVDTDAILAVKYMQSRAFARRHHQGLAVMYIDIINLNALKLKSEYEMKDLLQKILIRLQYCKRETDILSSVDENKFVLVISEVLLGDEINVVVNKIFKILSEDFIVNDNKIKLNANIGISIFPHDGEDIIELTQKAKIASIYLSSKDEAKKPFQCMFYDKGKMLTKKNEKRM